VLGLELSLYFHTIRHLQIAQIAGTIWRILKSSKPDLRSAPSLRPLAGSWQKPIGKQISLLTSNRFRFLNEEHDVRSHFDWNHPSWSKLWLYNLHYFDDLNAVDHISRQDKHRMLIERWIRENNPGYGIGWEPYPVSLRVVNWIKWALNGNVLSHIALHSLAVQTRYLRKRLEYHLMGNHLLTNAKALIFAGCYFAGKEADEWLDRGFRILNKELTNQVLPDGGHFELSPMYHSIVLEDLLDIINIASCYSIKFSIDSIIKTVPKMLLWLNIMTHPDGQIALFNDAAFGISSQPASLANYAHLLGLEIAKSSSITGIDSLSFGGVNIYVLKSSGYIRAEVGPITLILDTAPVGPDNLPGHAHADTMTFEMTYGIDRVIVDSGVSRYDECVDRLRQRGTSAHNTVVINSKDSSEVWKSFRVARRARPFDLTINETSNGMVMVRCAHDGYRRLSGQPVHWREWHFENNSLMIRDTIEGQYEDATGRFHFNSGISMEGNENGDTFIIQLPYDVKLFCRIQNGRGRLVTSSYHPEFGLTYQNKCLEVPIHNNKSQIIFNWK